MHFIDTHCHFDDARFDSDRAAVYQRAHAAGIRDIILPAVSAQAWPALKQACAQFAGLHASYGLHPMFIQHHHSEDLNTLAQWLQHEPAVAVGECGLDFYLESLPHDTQIDYFAAQITLALQHDLPLIVHARRAVDAVTQQLRRQPGTRGVVHSFSGSLQQAHKLIDLGFYLSFGGPLTYPRAQRLHRLASTLPLDALLLESDAPDQPDAAHRGERNEPAYLICVAQTLAELRGETLEHIAQTTRANAQRLFALNTNSTH